MASARFEQLLAGTAVALALALTPYAGSAFAASEAEIAAAVPMPESADLPPPSIKDVIAPADAAMQPETPAAAAPKPEAPVDAAAATPAAAETTNSTPAAGDRRRQVQHRVGLGRHGARRQASRPTGRRKIRPHPRRQEGARHRRGVLRKPRLRAALDRRRRDDDRAKAAAAYLAGVDADGLDPSEYPVPQIKAGMEPEALAEAEIKFTDAVLTFARHAMAGRVHYSRVSADIVYDLAKPDPANVLARIAKAQDAAAALDSLNPPQPQYKALKAKLAEMRKGADDVAKPMIAPGSGAEVQQGQEGQRGPDGGPARAGAARAVRPQVARRRHHLRQGAVRHDRQVPEGERHQRQRPAQRRRRSSSSTGPSARRRSTSSSPTWSAGAGCRATSARPT